MSLEPTRLAAVRSALFAIVIVVITVLHNTYLTGTSEAAARSGTAAVQTDDINGKRESPSRQNARYLCSGLAVSRASLWLTIFQSEPQHNEHNHHDAIDAGL